MPRIWLSLVMMSLKSTPLRMLKSTPSALSFGDYNGDDVLDIAVTNSADDDTTVLLSDP